MDYLNIPYELPDPFELPLTRLISIWKVEANDSYQCSQTKGFATPGMFLTFAGRGEFFLRRDRQRHVLEEGSCFIVEANEPCSYGCPKDSGWSFYFIHMSDLDMVGHLSIPIHEVARMSNQVRIKRLCERLICALMVRTRANMYESMRLLHAILIALSTEHAAWKPIQIQHHDITPALLWMHQNIEQPLNVNDLIRLCRVSRTTFYQSFRAVTGDTPSRYFYKLKLESARMSLLNSQQSLRQIASRLNFSDEFHLSVQFKKTYGVSPSRYRNVGMAWE
ncbi:AraC family transcriptional regulator [Alicyclobacillus acidiphilus]|uniref:AraC family transcriptional regulator n=1 Tax=Alicyclobacillus acidiphilus TaxID=182455 RepID=UPI00082FB0AA|nr:AraC family transcriptional regulator [Alicyclobacillus acidiphilus]